MARASAARIFGAPTFTARPNTSRNIQNFHSSSFRRCVHRTKYPILAAKGYAPTKVGPLRSLAVWAFHGGKDTVVPPSETEHMLDALKQAGVEEVHFTLYPDKQHDSWSETYNNRELYDWFLKHQRK